MSAELFFCNIRLAKLQNLRSRGISEDLNVSSEVFSNYSIAYLINAIFRAVDSSSDHCLSDNLTLRPQKRDNRYSLEGIKFS